MDRRSLAVLAALATLPVLCAALFGYDGHDYPFHLATWLEMREGWAAAELRPGWAALANHGLGDAHLQYYPPVTPVLAALLSLLLPLLLVPGAMLWLASFIAGSAMFAASGAFLKGRERLLAAALYALNPYLLTTALTRFAIGELFLQAWLPLVVLLLLRALSAETARTSARFALLLGGLLGLTWLTNVPGSIALGYLLGCVCLALAVGKRSLKPLLVLGTAELLGIGLAAFHHLPAFAERSFVQAGQLLQIERWFMVLPLGTSARLFGLNGVILTWVGAAVVIACWLRLGPKRRASTPGFGLLVGMAGLAFFFLLPISNFLWNRLPLFNFIQLPLRFMAEIYVVLPLAALLMPLPRPWRGLLLAGVASLALLPIAMKGHASGWGKRATSVAAVLEDYAHGYQGQPEYWPAAASGIMNGAQIAAIPAVAVVGDAAARCDAKVVHWQRQDRAVQVSASAPCQLRLKLLCHPYWTSEARPPAATELTCDTAGLVLARVPAGEHVVSLRYQPASPLRTGTAAVSAITLVGLLGALWWLRARSPRPSPST